MTARITIEPGKRSGQPCIRGLRITVWDGLNWLAGGEGRRARHLGNSTRAKVS
jgi:uncharacterized protein (DUF433 family)